MSFENPADAQTCWCIYCVCGGYGKGAIPSCKENDVLCKGQQKCCCFKGSSEGLCAKFAGDEGICFGLSQFCCIISSFQFIPTKPFIEICGKRVCGSKKNAVAGSSFGYSGEDPHISDLESELETAVKEQDFLREYH